MRLSELDYIQVAHPPGFFRATVSLSYGVTISVYRNGDGTKYFVYGPKASAFFLDGCVGPLEAQCLLNTNLQEEPCECPT